MSTDEWNLEQRVFGSYQKDWGYCKIKLNGGWKAEKRTREDREREGRRREE